MARLEERRRAGADEPALPAPRGSRRILQKVLLGVVLLVVIAYAVRSSAPPVPDVAPDCARAAIHLSRTTIRSGGDIRYAVVGPPQATYQLAVDATGFRRDASGGLQPQPSPGLRDTAASSASTSFQMPSCKHIGTFGVPLEVGMHTVRLFRLVGDGPAAVVVATATVEVAPNGRRLIPPRPTGSP
ncbi:MAG: hypothetical protein ABR520_04505 [Mycobacteriales bacterium]|nr:hypothetical protein [Frankia sp.]